MTAPSDRTNPLASALEDAAVSPEARGYAISVDAVRHGVRRRRAWRAGGVVAAAVVLVGGAVAGSAWAGRSGPSPVAEPPASGTTPAPTGTADWPAQFGRCGQPADQVLPDLGGPMTLTLADATASVPTDRGWRATVTADLPTAGDVSAVVWATDLSVVRDGVVVGVQDGPTAPDLSESLTERLGDDAFRTSPFPVATDVTLAFASCDPYPSGQGSPELAPGTYDLVVTQTLSYTTTPGPVTDVTDVRASTRTTVTITGPAATMAPADADPTACGSPADALAALADPQRNPVPFTLAMNGHPSPSEYPNYPMTPTLTNVGAQTLTGSTDDPVLVLTQGGVVAGRSVVTGGHAITSTAVTATADGNDIGTLPPGQSVGYPDPPIPAGCATDSPGLPPGDYEMWLFVDVRLGGEGPLREYQVVGGPWPSTVDAD